MERPKRFFIAEHARANGKRQRDIAAATGLTKGYVSGLWSGKKEPSPDAAAAIANAIGIPPRALLEPPGSLQIRAITALNRIPAEKRETAIEMLEGLARRK